MKEFKNISELKEFIKNNDKIENSFVINNDIYKLSVNTADIYIYEDEFVENSITIDIVNKTVATYSLV